MSRLLYILRMRPIHKNLVIFSNLALPCETQYSLLIFNRFIVLPLVDHHLIQNFVLSTRRLPSLLAGAPLLRQAFFVTLGLDTL